MTLRHNPNSIILGEHPLSEVMTVVNSGKNSSRMVINKRIYSVGRMKVFAMHGCKCTKCGIEGTKVLLSQDRGGGLHLDLYAERDGGFVLMNRDHILPASLGGRGHVWNMRPMCQPCNTKRGNVYTGLDKELYHRRKTMHQLYTKFRSRSMSHLWSYRLARVISKVFTLRQICLVWPI